jgi:hypothetical protein
MAKFSKAHYIALAKVIKMTEEAFGSNYEDCYPSDILPELKGNLGNMLYNDNPKFDRDRFLEACEPEVKQ